MIRSFSNNQSYVLIFIPIIVLIQLALSHYFPTFSELVQGQDNLWNLDFFEIPYLLSTVLTLIFVSVNAIVLNLVFNIVEFYDRLTYIPSVLYVFLIFLFPSSLYFNETLIAHFFFILSFYQLFEVNQNEDARNRVFLSGLFLGLAGTFQPVYLTFLIVIWIGIYITRPLILREFILPLAGLFLPFLWVILVNDNLFDEILTFHVNFDLETFNKQLFFISLSLLLLFIAFGFKTIFERRKQSSIRFKRIVTILLLSFFYGLGLTFIAASLTDSIYYFTIVIAILPFILSYIFIKIKYKWVSYTLFYSLIIVNIVKFFLV